MQQTDDLANRPEFAPVVEYGKRILDHLATIRGRTVIPPKSRSAVLGKHEAFLATEGVQSSSADGEAPWISYLFNRSPASRTPLAELKKIALGELRWCEVMRGRVLVVRTIAQPCVVEGALCAVIEDEHGAVHNLRVYNVEYTDARNVLPFGVPLAIKEPYCEAAMEDTSGVRVDHPSDLVYLSEGDPHHPENWRTTFPDDLPCSPSEKLKDEGNECFKKGLHREAICKYTAALRRDPSQALKTSILLNRSQSHLLLGSYAKAVADAEEIIKAPGDQPNEKALFRGARALYALSRYDKAQTFSEQLTSAFPQNKDAKVLLAKTKIRLAEQQFGKYDWVSLISEAKKSTPRAEVADYMGPIGLSGKGFLTAKNDIKAGELLLCHKAVAVLYPPEMKDEKSMLIYDTVRGSLGRGEGLKLTQKVVDRVSHDPTSRESIYSLVKWLKVYDTISSDTQTQEVDGESIVDIHILDTIRETYADPFPVLHPVVPVSVPPAQGLGLWPLGTTAHLAHSCLPNACRSFLGDVLILRARRDIAHGETISIAYMHPTLPLEERRAVLGRTPGASCSCRFCEIEEKEGTAIRQQRVDLLQKVKEISERAPAETLRTDAGRDQSNAPEETVVRQVVKEVTEIYDQLEATFTHSTYEQPRFPLLETLAYLVACYLYLGPNSTEDALKVNARYLTSLGFSFEYDSAPDAGNEKSGGGDVRVLQHGFYHPFIVRALVQQSSVCWQLGKRRTADAWRRVAENSMEIITGHRKLFRDGYSKVYESLKWEL